VAFNFEHSEGRYFIGIAIRDSKLSLKFFQVALYMKLESYHREEAVIWNRKEAAYQAARQK